MTVLDAQALAAALEYIVRARRCLCGLRKDSTTARDNRKELRISLRQLHRELDGMKRREIRRLNRRVDRRRRLEEEKPQKHP